MNDLEFACIELQGVDALTQTESADQRYREEAKRFEKLLAERFNKFKQPQITTATACDVIRRWWVRQSDQPGKTPGTRKIVDKVDVELLLDEIHHEGL